MSSCPIHGPLLGGYVLGALEPREMVEMEQHVSKCPHCGPESRRLAALPTLLDEIQPADVPPPTLSPSVEEALLDRFARERRRHRRTRRARLTPRRILALAGACVAALAVALALVWPASDDDGGQVTYARAKLGPPAGSAVKASAVAYASDVPAGTRVSLRARGLRGGVYELWCVRPDGSWVSGGSFRSGRDGHAEAQLTAAVRRGDYHVMVVTRNTRDEGAHGKEVLRGQLVY